MTSKDKLEFDVKFRSEQAAKELRRTVESNLANIAVALSVPQNSVQAAVKQIQAVLDGPNGIQMFNEKTGINQQKLSAYIKRLIKEIDKAVAAHPDMALKIGFNVKDAIANLEKQLMDVEAKVRVGMEIDTAEIENLRKSVSGIADSFNAEFNKIQFGSIVANFQQALSDFKTASGELPNAVRDAVDKAMKELDRLSTTSITLPELDAQALTTLRELVTILNNPAFSDNSNLVSFFGQLGTAINQFNGNVHDTANVRTFADSLTSLAVSMIDVREEADRMLHGSFGQLLDAVSNLDVAKIDSFGNAMRGVVDSVADSQMGQGDQRAGSENVGTDGTGGTDGAVAAIHALHETLKKFHDAFSKGGIDQDNDVPAIGALHETVRALHRTVQGLGGTNGGNGTGHGDNTQSNEQSQDNGVENEGGNAQQNNAVTDAEHRLREAQRMFDRRLGEMREQLERFSQIRVDSPFADFDVGLIEARAAIDPFRDELQESATQNSGLQSRLEDLRRNFSDGRITVDEYRAGLGELTDAYTALSTNLQSNEITSALERMVDGFDGYVQRLHTFVDSFQSAGDSMESFVRNLHMAGLSLPRSISLIVGGLGNMLRAFGTARSMGGTMLNRAFRVGGSVGTTEGRIGQFVSALGGQADDRVTDASGQQRTLQDVARETLTEGNRVFLNRRDADGNMISRQQAYINAKEYVRRTMRERMQGEWTRGGTAVADETKNAAREMLTGGGARRINNIIGGSATSASISSMGQLVSGTGGIGRIANMVGIRGTSGVSVLLGGSALVGAGAAMAVVKYAEEAYKVFRENQKRMVAKRAADSKFITNMEIQSVTQTSTLEQAKFKSVMELERKRFAQQSELRKSRMEMNSDDLAAQEELYQIELARLKAQKEGEQLHTKAGQVGESTKTILEYNKGLIDAQAGAEYETGMFYTFLGARDIAYDKHGKQVDESIMDETEKWWFSGEQIALESALNTGSEIARAANAAFVADLDQKTAAYQEIIETIASLEGDEFSVGFKNKLDGIQKEIADLTKKQAKNEFSIEFTDMLQMTFDEAVKARVIQWNDEIKAWMYQDQNRDWKTLTKGEATDQNDSSGMGAGQLALLREQNKALIEQNEAAKTTLDEKLKQADLTIEEARREKAITDAYLKRREAQIALEKEMRNNLFAKLKESWTALSEWEESNLTKQGTRDKLIMDMRHEAEMRDPRLLYNPDAKMGIEMRHSQEVAYQSEDAKLKVRQDWELFQKRLDMENKIFEQRKTNEMAVFTLRKDWEMKLFQARMENRKEIRELAYKLQQYALEAKRATAVKYGKDTFDIEKALKEIVIKKQYDEQVSGMTKKHNTEIAKWESDEKRANLADVQKLQEENLQKQNDKELEFLAERQKIERDALEAEFKLRIKQIEFEVRYRHLLEQQQKDMETADTEDWLKNDLTYEEWEAVNGRRGKTLSAQDKQNFDNMTEQQRRDLVRNFSAEEQDFLAGRRKEVYFTRMDDLRKQMGATVIENGDFAGKNLEGYIASEFDRLVNITEEQKAQLSEEDKARAELLQKFAVKVDGDTDRFTLGHGEGATVEDQQNLSAWKNDLTRTFAAAYSAQEFDKKIGDLELERNNNFEAVENRRLKWIDDHSTNGRDPIAEADAAKEELKKLVGGSFFWNSNWDRKTESDPYLILNKENEEKFNKLADILNLSERQRTDILNTSQNLSFDRMASDSDKTSATNIISGIVDEQYNTSGFMKDNEGNIGEATRDALKRSGEIDTEITDIQKQEQDFNAMVTALSEYGDAETAAIIAQTNLQNTHAEKQEALLEEMTAALTGGKESKAFLDIKKKLADFDQDVSHQMKTLQQSGEQAVKNREQELETKTEDEKNQREGNFEDAKKDAEYRRDRRLLKNETDAEFAKLRAQLRAEAIRIRGGHAQQQASTDTDFLISMGTAKTGFDITQAYATRSRENQYNMLKQELELRHQREKIQMEKGGATDEERAQLEVRQNSELVSLDNSKKIADTVANNMPEVGTLRSLISDNTGSKEDLKSSWERIQAAAFGHIEDPAADAIINLQRDQQLQHAALMSVLTMNLPQIVQRLSTGNGKMAIPQNIYNSFMGTPTGMGGGLAGGNSPAGRS